MTISDDVLSGASPLVLRGFVQDWPLVSAAMQSDQAAEHYLRAFASEAPITATIGGASIRGHVSYVEDLTKPNVQRLQMPLASLLDRCNACAVETEPPLYYMASTEPEACLPGLADANPMTLGDRRLLASVWIGNNSRIPAHYDLPDNIACVAVGKRRFTLFPPDQLENLYPGPLDMTPAGQPISVVDFHNPDFDKYPKYKRALAAAMTADLEPGDAIFIPSMWWHQVEALSSLNVLMNYWWRQSPAYMGPPVDALYHALLTIRDLPSAQKEAWKTVFDQYVFGDHEQAAAHIPEEVRGPLGPMDDTMARRIRAYLLNRLNR